MNERVQDLFFPPDQLIVTPDRFLGKGFVLTLTGNMRPIVTPVRFDAPRGTTLDPFYYDKPVVNQHNSSVLVEIIQEEIPRVGYYPLAVVWQAMRPPNHLYRVEDAFFAAVNKRTEEKPDLQTRYFPKSSVDETVWQQVYEILGLSI